jgi:hypothetical protein
MIHTRVVSRFFCVMMSLHAEMELSIADVVLCEAYSSSSTNPGYGGAATWHHSRMMSKTKTAWF